MADDVVTRSTGTGDRVGTLAASVHARWPNARVMLALAASAALAVVGFATVLGAFYPGLMSPDSMHQLHQALTGQFESGHPPIMAWTWSLLMALGGGIGSLL